MNSLNKECFQWAREVLIKDLNVKLMVLNAFVNSDKLILKTRLMALLESSVNLGIFMKDILKIINKMGGLDVSIIMEVHQ